VAKRDDDQDWSGQTRVDLGQQGDYISYRDWFPGGVFRRRQYRVRYSSGVDMAITDAIDFWSPYGSNEEEAA
jgi:hypothetical protein